MKLYRMSSQVGHFYPTQEEAKAAAKWQGRTFSKIEVPTSEGREALCAFLNGIVDDAASLKALAEKDIMNIYGLGQPAIPLSPAEQDAAHPETAKRGDDIVAFILDEAPVHIVENIFAAIGTRFGELVKGLR